MTTVFLDTVGLLALWDEDDQWHDCAQAAFDRLLREDLNVVTSAFVLLECGNAAARRPYRETVCELRDELLAGGRLIQPTDSEVTAAWRDYRQGTAAHPGIVDLTSFAIMRRLGLTRVFGNDSHFRVAGFETLF